VRLFFAIWPAPETAHAMAHWAREVHEETGGSLTPAEKIHLTLAFLGDADAGNARNAAQRVRAPRHVMPVDQAKYWKHNKIVWAGPRAMPPGLASLVNQLHAALEAHAFVLEARPFAAHITLLRKAKPPKALPPLPALEWAVSEFVLVRSRISPKGPAYEAIERFTMST
jgi:RNA 2',3'-cyclic 3'-phosphodiesterase